MSDDNKKLEMLLTEEQMNNKIRFYAKVTMKKGAEVEVHQHINEMESYYILSGEGIYEEDGKKYPAKAGDHFYCNDGSSHGIVATSEEPLVFMALIILK